jgi:diguanylate cyclase (GGDEF)-like protein
MNGRFGGERRFGMRKSRRADRGLERVGLDARHERDTWLVFGDRRGVRTRSLFPAWPWVLAAMLMLLACNASAYKTPELRIALYEPGIAPAVLDVGKLPSGVFHDVPPGSVSLHGEAEDVHWLRLTVDLPALAEDDARWVVWIDRVRVDRLALRLPDGGELAPVEPVDFFAPNGNPAVHPGGYGFTLPRALSGPTTLYLEVIGQGSFSLLPEMKTESDVVVIDNTAVIVFTAVYTGLILLLLIGLGMYIALRDRLYLYYLCFLGALLMFVLAYNGHLYGMPWFDVLGRWRTLGLNAFGNVLAIATVALARRFAGLPRSASGLDRLLALFPTIPLTLVLLCVFNLPAWAPLIQIATTAVALVAMLLAAIATAMAWRYNRHFAMPVLLVWLLLFASGCIRAAVPYGMATSNAWTQYSYQVIATLNGLLLGFALSDRIIEFRLQRDRARLAKDQVDASLKIERERRRFIESLHSGLREAPSGDQEWMAFRRLLEALRELIPQHSSAVSLNAFHGNSMLLCEPTTARDEYQALLSARGGAFKGISRSQLPMQLRIDGPVKVVGEAPELMQFAVLPLPLVAPAWGVLLIQRRGWQAFDNDELILAAELAQKATQAVVDGADDRSLRVNADFDALTGAFNRRTVDARLNSYFKQSIARRAPLSVLFVDLDHLKEINDVHGHAAGDKCLHEVAETLRLHCGTVGIFGRYGGDEFVVILPDFNPEHAGRWAETFRADVTGRELALASGKLRLRVSIGVANRFKDDLDVKQLVERADKALYAAKRMGRDQVQAAATHGAVRGVGIG